MSCWTHVNGIIRVSDVESLWDGKDALNYFLKVRDSFNDIPAGSEGPLVVRVLNDGERGSSNTGPNGSWVVTSYDWIVTITGNLRDYGRYKKDIVCIVKWLNKSVKSLCITDGIVTIGSIHGVQFYHHAGIMNNRKKERFNLVLTKEEEFL
jgi:hypothetical protein